MSFTFTFFTKNPTLASWASSCGVSRIGVDLESIGKKERQPSSFRISSHTIQDLSLIKNYIKPSQLFCRINPINKLSQSEIEAVISVGVKHIMLPMFNSIEEVNLCENFINRRANLIPLIETEKSCKIVKEISKTKTIKEVHVGLNDLHLSLKLENFYDVFDCDIFRRLMSDLSSYDLRFGLGGIAKYHDEALALPSRENYKKYHETGASGAIISRSLYAS